MVTVKNLPTEKLIAIDVILATLLKNNYYMFTPKYLLQFSMTDYLMDTSLSRWKKEMQLQYINMWYCWEIKLLTYELDKHNTYALKLLVKYEQTKKAFAIIQKWFNGFFRVLNPITSDLMRLGCYKGQIYLRVPARILLSTIVTRKISHDSILIINLISRSI